MPRKHSFRVYEPSDFPGGIELGTFDFEHTARVFQDEFERKHSSTMTGRTRIMKVKRT